MVKPSSTNNRRPIGTPRDQYRIGFADLSSENMAMHSLWNSEAEKYKVLCRMVHVTKACLQVGYIQLAISFIFCTFFAYHYLLAVTGHLSPDHWLNAASARYISQLLLAISLQLILVVVMLHGVRSERRSLLLPYIVYASITTLFGIYGLVNDFISMDQSNGAIFSSAASDELSAIRKPSPDHQGRALSYSNSQFIPHLIGIFIHAWCLSVVWRCYGYLGDKKVARQISEQLSSTQAAFHYPEQHLLGFMMPQPPPYADTVATGPVMMAPPPAAPAAAVLEQPAVSVTAEEDKQIV